MRSENASRAINICSQYFKLSYSACKNKQCDFCNGLGRTCPTHNTTNMQNTYSKHKSSKISTTYTLILRISVHQQIYPSNQDYKVCRIDTITVKSCKPLRSLYPCNTSNLKMQDGYKRLQEAPKMAMKSTTQYSYFCYPANLWLLL